MSAGPEFFSLSKSETNGSKSKKHHLNSDSSSKRNKKKKDGDSKDPNSKKKSSSSTTTGKNGETKGKRGRKSLASTGGVSAADKKRKHDGEKKAKKHHDDDKRTRASPKREQENEGAEALLSLASLAGLATTEVKKESWDTPKHKKENSRFSQPSPTNAPINGSNGTPAATQQSNSTSGFNGKFSILDLVSNDSNQQNIAPQTQPREQRNVAANNSHGNPQTTPGPMPFTRPFKRCATHVWIAYHIYYMQRQQAIAQAQAQAPDITLLSSLQSSNNSYPKNYFMPLLDPTLEARMLKERADQQKRKTANNISSPNASSSVFNNVPHSNPMNPSNINSMMNLPPNAGPSAIALLQQQHLLQMQLQQAHAAASSSQFSSNLSQNNPLQLQQFQQQNLMNKFPLQFQAQQGSTPSPQMQAQFAQQIQSQLVLLQQTGSVPSTLNQFPGFSQLPNNFNYLMQQPQMGANPIGHNFQSVGQNQQNMPSLPGLQNSHLKNQEMLMRNAPLGMNQQKDSIGKSSGFSSNLPGINDIASKISTSEASREAQRPTLTESSKNAKDKKIPDLKSVIDLASEDSDSKPKTSEAPQTSSPPPSSAAATKEPEASKVESAKDSDEEEEEKGMEIIDEEEKETDDKTTTNSQQSAEAVSTKEAAPPAVEEKQPVPAANGSEAKPVVTEQHKSSVETDGNGSVPNTTTASTDSPTSSPSSSSSN
eukprot:TRINITY_DN3891_c0_g1_i1.p2 TRINITY_DN3891_c0_g1~~TRINITY_DN3891_c0_g1_i1.p2  ORF type:complete len:709 (-),score=190.99 TRINITY_DN3891_c0_g1_i1:20-2146(-)